MTYKHILRNVPFIVVFTLTFFIVALPALAAPLDSGLPSSGSTGDRTLKTIIGTITGLVLSLVPIVATLTLIFFFYNLFQLIMNTADAEKHKQARPRLLWSIVVMFVIFSVWGIVALLSKTFFDSSSGGLNLNPYDPTGTQFSGPQQGTGENGQTIFGNSDSDFLTGSENAPGSQGGTTGGDSFNPPATDPGRGTPTFPPDSQGGPEFITI